MTKRTLITLFAVAALAAGPIGCGEDDDGDGGGTAPMGGDGPPTSGAPEGTAGSGGGVSLGAPAMCSSGDDCPEGVECVLPAGGSVGFCNVDETQASGDGGEASTDGGEGVPVSIGAPAPCNSDADCGGQSCNRPFDDEPGFCDVQEMQAQP